MPRDPKGREADERAGASPGVVGTLTHAESIRDCASVHPGACSGRANPAGVPALPYRATSLARNAFPQSSYLFPIVGHSVGQYTLYSS